jgi:hypothetical protein
VHRLAHTFTTSSLQYFPYLPRNRYSYCVSVPASATLTHVFIVVSFTAVVRFWHGLVHLSMYTCTSQA